MIVHPYPDHRTDADFRDLRPGDLFRLPRADDPAAIWIKVESAVAAPHLNPVAVDIRNGHMTNMGPGACAVARVAGEFHEAPPLRV